MTEQQLYECTGVKINTNQVVGGFNASAYHPEGVSFRDFPDTVLDKDVIGFGKTELEAKNNFIKNIDELTMVVGNKSYFLRDLKLSSE